MEQGQEKTQVHNQYTFMPFGFTHFNLPFTFGFVNFNSTQPELFPVGLEQVTVQQKKQTIDQNIQYFKSFFSPKETAESLQRRNENLQMLSFQISDEEPDDIYNRRKKKVNDLLNQEKQQVQCMLNIRRESEQKFDAIIEFIKFFCLLKQSLPGIRTDYYSTKTFCALKNASEDQLISLTKVMQKMYNNITKVPLKMREGFKYSQSQLTQIQNRTLQFLIIPRFLISKQKINRLVRDEELQRNFQYLVVNQCLGHYNNEANKKMPQEKHMKFVREVLSRTDGRELFKKICSINHGNKFFKCYPSAYYNLYSQNFNYLKHLDNSLKSGKKFESIRKDLERMAKESAETVGNSSFTQNQSSNGIYSFKSMGECLNKIANQEQKNIKSEGQNMHCEVESKVQQFKMLKKIMSTPIHQQQVQQRTFKVRKFKTMQQKKQQNIILVCPPSYSQI